MIAALSKVIARLFGIRKAPRHRPQALPDQIKRAVCGHFGIDASTMTSAARNRHLVRPRQIAMYLCREIAGRSYPEIGRLFGNRDHTTALYACRKIKSLMQSDPGLAATVATLRASLEYGVAA